MLVGRAASAIGRMGRSTPSVVAEVGGRVREGLAASERARPRQVRHQVAVAELEPLVDAASLGLRRARGMCRPSMPHPRSSGERPASVYITVSRSGLMWSPQCRKSSPVFTTTVSAPAGGRGPGRPRAARPRRPPRERPPRCRCRSVSVMRTGRLRGREAAPGTSRGSAGNEALEPTSADALRRPGLPRGPLPPRPSPPPPTRWLRALGRDGRAHRDDPRPAARRRRPARSPPCRVERAAPTSR